MAATVRDIVVEDSFQLVVEVDDDDGEPRDLTGFTGGMQIRASRDDPTSTLLAEGDVEVDADLGLVVVTIGDTSAMTWIAGYYDVVITDGDGPPERIVEGRAVLRQGVTVI
jgi:hypothetical protein